MVNKSFCAFISSGISFRTTTGKLLIDDLMGGLSPMLIGSVLSCRIPLPVIRSENLKSNGSIIHREIEESSQKTYSVNVNPQIMPLLLYHQCLHVPKKHCLILTNTFIDHKCRGPSASPLLRCERVTTGSKSPSLEAKAGDAVNKKLEGPEKKPTHRKALPQRLFA